MSNKRSPPVIVATRAILLFVKDLDDRIFSSFGDFSRYYPNVDKDVVKELDECGVIAIQYFGRNVF